MTSEIDYLVHNYDVTIKHRTCKDYLTEREKKQLIDDGFIKLKTVMNNETVKKLRTIADNLATQKFGDTNKPTYKSKRFGGQYIRQPHLQSMHFLKLLTNSYPYVDIVRSVMGPRILVRSFSIRITNPQTNQETMWHSDQRSKITPRPIFFTEPHVFTVSIYLDQANEYTGQLSVIPGSHSLDKQPSDDEIFSSFTNQVDLTINEGEAVFFHSALWHKGGQNVSHKRRRAIIIHFAPVFCKTANYESIPRSRCYEEFIESLYKSSDEPMLELLGHIGLKPYDLFM